MWPMRRRWLSMIAVASTLVGCATGCAAQRAEGPLEIRLGLTPRQTAQAVRAYDFCRRVDPDAVVVDQPTEEIFPECGRPGVTDGDSWVVAHYRDGAVVRIQRFERWPSASRAAERWNQLIEKRSTGGAASQYARDVIFKRQRIPDGTEAWVAWQRGDELIGLYLLRTADATEPSIMEEIVPLESGE